MRGEVKQCCNLLLTFTDAEMSNALQELKALLLSKSVRTFERVHQGSSIVRALQSLLRVAEMRNKCCFLEDCTHPTLARRHMFAMNISTENDRLMNLPEQNDSTGIHSTDFYNHSDGDSTETDNSYETAEEGYDVSNNKQSMLRKRDTKTCLPPGRC